MTRGAALVLVLAGCDGCPRDAEPVRCRQCEEPAKRGALEAEDIDEASGLAASRRHPNRFYLHNDAGGRARIFVIDEQGRDLGTLTLKDVEAVDWEDIAVGPCDETSCIFVGDIGDNDRERDEYAVFRVEEPAHLTGDVAAERIAFRYPDGAQNAETLLADPKTGALYVVTKVEKGASSVYALPASGGVATRVGEVTPPEGSTELTAGDIHPAGEGILLRSKRHAFYYPLVGGDVGGAFRGAACPMPLAGERQGEAVAWLASGAGYLTVSEGRHSHLFVVRCSP